MPLLPAAIGIVFNSRQTEVLLVKRRDIPIWVLPGGGVESGETVEAAVKREVYEETGLHIQVIRQGAVYHPINRLTAKTSVFICHIESGIPRLSSETAAVSFYPLDSLPKNTFHLHADWLSEILSSSSLIQRSLIEVTYRRLLKYFFRHPFLIFRYAWTRFFS